MFLNLFLIGRQFLYNVVFVLPYNNMNQPQYTHIPLLLSLPSIHLGHHRAPSWVPCVIQLLHTTYFALGSVYMSCATLLIHPTSVQFSCPVVSRSLWPHGLQHARPSCPSPTPGVYSNSYSLSPHPIITSFVVPFSSCLLSFPTSGSFHMSQFFASGGQSIGVSASTSVLPMNIKDWSPLG